MGTQSHSRASGSAGGRPGAAARPRGLRADPVDEVALACAARRRLLLRVHRHRLRREDLEDAYAQASLELFLFVRRGGRFSNRRHLLSAIEGRFLARVADRRRAMSGRSPIETLIEQSAALGGEEEPGRVEPADTRPGPERIVLARDEIRQLRADMETLSADQRLVLRAQARSATRAEFLTAHDEWSAEKYRKVAQRGRARLIELARARAAPLTDGVPLAARASDPSAGPTCDE